MTEFHEPKRVASWGRKAAMSGVARYCIVVLSAMISTDASSQWATGTASYPPIDIEAEATQPASHPVLLQLKLTNTRPFSIYYWCGGPARYPNLLGIEAEVLDSQGKATRSFMFNGQYEKGSGGGVEIKTGESVEFPAAVPPLPPGNYLIRVRKGNIANVTIKDDWLLRYRREITMLARSRKGEQFAQCVVLRSPIRTLTEQLLSDLSSGNADEASNAADMLYHYAKLPSNAIAMIGNALHERSGPNGGGWSKLYTASSLVSLVARDGSDEALDWVLAWADGQKRCSKRADAVEALEDFRQPRAAKALRAFLKDSDPDVRYGAAAALARRRDPSAIETLIAITGDKESPWGCMAYYLLAIFPNDPRVLPVIEAAAQDSGARFHTQALSALESLRDAQKH